MSISGLLAACLHGDPDARHDEARGEQSQGLGRSPAPGGGLADRQQHGRDADRHQGGGQPVDAAGNPYRRLGDEPPGGDGRDDGGHERDPEQPVVVEVLDDHAGEHDPHAGADAEDRRQQPDASRHLLARELVADDAEREREDPAARTLDEAGHDDHPERARHGRQQGAGGEDHERDQQQALLAVHVAQAAQDGRAHGGREQVGGQQPGDARLVGVQRVLHRGQRRHHRGAEHRVGHTAERQHGQDQRWMSALCGGRVHRDGSGARGGTGIPPTNWRSRRRRRLQ